MIQRKECKLLPATQQGLESLLEKNYRVGDSVTLTLIRDGQTLELPVELVEEPNN
jgi:S1-C subfamily serine protease